MLDMHHHPGFLCWCWAEDLNSGPHTYQAYYRPRHLPIPENVSADHQPYLRVREHKTFSSQSGLLSFTWSFTPYSCNHHFSSIGWVPVLKAKQTNEALIFSSPFLLWILGLSQPPSLARQGEVVWKLLSWRTRPETEWDKSVHPAVSWVPGSSCAWNHIMFWLGFVVVAVLLCFSVTWANKFPCDFNRS